MRRLRSIINILFVILVPNFHSYITSYASTVVGQQQKEKEEEQQRRQNLECNEDAIDPIIHHWSIPEPTYETHLSRITLHYELYQTITKEDFEIIVYSDHQCGASTSSNVIDRPYLSIGVVEDKDESSLLSSCSKKYDVPITINPSEIMKTPSYTLSSSGGDPKNNNNNSTTADIQLCVKMILYDSVQSDDDDTTINTAIAATPSDRIPVTINEMLLTLSCDITKNFLITNSDVVLKSTLKKEAIEKLAELNGYNVTIYQCDRQLNSIEKPQYDNGSSQLLPLISRSDNPIRICITPDDIALQQGIKIDKINYFYYQQNDGNNTLLRKQKAVHAGGKLSKDQLSILSCQIGSIKCAVETELRPQFFKNGDNEVIIYGEVKFINFGSKPFEEDHEHIIANETATSGDNSRRLESLKTSFQYKFKIGKENNIEEMVQSASFDKEKKKTQEENEVQLWITFKKRFLPTILGVYITILALCTAFSIMDAKKNRRHQINRKQKTKDKTTKRDAKGNDNTATMDKGLFGRKNSNDDTIKQGLFNMKDNNSNAMRKEFDRGPIPDGFTDEIFDCI